MTNVSGLGTIITLFASVTYPSGIVISQFPDDADSINVEPIAIGETAMGVNGDLIVWNKASPVAVAISVIPDSDDDINLSILAENNRSGKYKLSIRDEITLTKADPDGFVTTYTGGIITNAPMGTSVAGSSRKKTKTYTFAFENRIGD